jgi:3-deoxy-D-manno-octulosonate 8-phosphate phosphatase (KDO 8-P phosphatase)
MTVAERFSGLGGTFLNEPSVIAQRLSAARGIVCDWDGVFNRGVKGEGSTSTFSEADSMGTNLLRYALWRRNGKLPVCAIITGEHNPSARRFVEREHFDVLYQGVKDKSVAVEELCSAHGLSREQLICVFDDVNDLSMAVGCGVRVLVRRAASPLLVAFAEEHKLADYITGCGADQYALRETSELLLGLMGAYETVLQSRIEFDDSYQGYLAARQAIVTQLARH